jgi:nitrate/nitrite transporter NarK
MFLPLVGGFMFDKLGPNVALFMFGSLVLIGNVLISIACYYKSMSFYIFGRFVFGLGAESLGVTASGVISMYFKTQELAFALGVNLSVCKLAGVLTDWFSPYFDKTLGFYGAANMVTFFCFICFLLTLALILCEHPEDEKKRNERLAAADAAEEEAVDHASYMLVASEESESEHGAAGAAGLGSNGSSGSSSAHDQAEQGKAQLLAGDGQEDQFELQKPHGGHCDTLRSFSSTLWILLIYTFMMYGIYIPFSNVANALLVQIYFGGDLSALDPAREAEHEQTAAW